MILKCEGIDRAISEMQLALNTLGGKEGMKKVANALNQALAAGRKEAASEARKAYTAPIRKLFDNIRVERARGSSLRGEIELSGTPGVSLYHFKPSVKDMKTRPKAGVSSQVKRGGSRYIHSEKSFLPHSKPFILKKKQGGYGIFVKKAGVTGKKDWKNYRMLFGPSPVQAIERADVQEKIREKIEETFVPCLQAELDRALAKFRSAK